jgi:hypothetical protein
MFRPLTLHLSPGVLTGKGEYVLRVAEVVRYQAEGKHNRYRLKHPSELKSILSSPGAS